MENVPDQEVIELKKGITPEQSKVREVLLGVTAATMQRVINDLPSQSVDPQHRVFLKGAGALRFNREVEDYFRTPTDIDIAGNKGHFEYFGKANRGSEIKTAGQIGLGGNHVNLCESNGGSLNGRFSARFIAEIEKILNRKVPSLRRSNFNFHSISHLFIELPNDIRADLLRLQGIVANLQKSPETYHLDFDYNIEHVDTLRATSNMMHIRDYGIELDDVRVLNPVDVISSKWILNFSDRERLKEGSRVKDLIDIMMTIKQYRESVFRKLNVSENTASDLIDVLNDCRDKLETRINNFLSQAYLFDTDYVAKLVRLYPNIFAYNPESKTVKCNYEEMILLILGE